jgi:hypothetical protein
VLGYRLEPRNGYKTSVHVKPWSKRTKRFKNKLAIKLEKAEPGTALFAIAEGYRVNWFNSQSAWTKVPQISDSVSASITMSYVVDFMLGVPMGAWQVKNPQGGLITRISKCLCTAATLSRLSSGMNPSPASMPSRRRQPVNPSSRCYSGVWRVERSEIQSRMLGLPAPANWSVCRSDGARREAALSGTLAVGSLTTP